MAYIDSYQFDLDQELAAERRAGYGRCPRCGGHPEMDEYGMQYTCFYCCNRGEVPQAWIDAEERAERDFMEQFRPTYLGTVPRQARADDWMLDADDPDFAPLPAGRGLFTTLIPRAALIDRTALVDLTDDDIPF